VLILMGGDDFFSNGINLNIMEDSKKKAEDGWSNLNSMNELIKTILYSDEFFTVAALKGSAGAGGVFLAAACDYVVAREGVVLNPHYMTLGLYGSEYWTYILPKRTGSDNTGELMQKCLPISVKKAKQLGLVDKVFNEEQKEYYIELEYFSTNLAENRDYCDQLITKTDRLKSDDTFKSLESYKEEELREMRPSFYEESAAFHKLRHDFVYKTCPSSTPQRLAIHKMNNRCTNTA